MESSTNRTAEQEKKQAEIRKQIAILQAQLVETTKETTVEVSCPSTPPPKKRKEREATTLAPATPSPKKRKLEYDGTFIQRDSISHSKSASKVIKKPQEEFIPPKLASSTVLSKLAGISSKTTETHTNDGVNRSSAFSDTPKRDERLVLVEDLEIGPYEHKPSFDDPLFDKIEPNSGIHLSSRIIPHGDIQAHLTDRYYLSPSRLYSVIRLLPDKQGYDVPVTGDWVTIAVVAERGPIKYTKAPVAITHDDTGGDSKPWKEKVKHKSDGPPKPTGKKYVNIKLIDFGSRSRSSSSATGGKAVIRGDAFLNLLLFESDGFDRVTRESGQVEKVYRGGSKGAFEVMSRVKEGDVIALLNPKVLKPFQRSSDSPHPTNNILALTPESASSIAVIGRARDLGMCTVQKRDGKVCGSWYDKRMSNVCEWHVQNAVERRRAGRAEFSAGTSGMSTTAGPKHKPEYDPGRQWGLKPAEKTDSGGSTYVISGHIIRGSGSDSRSLFSAENIGREGQAKAARKMNTKDSDRALKALLERDKEGTRALVKAREAASQTPKGGQKKNLNSQIKPGQKKIEERDVQKKLDALASVQSSRKEPILGPRPGPRIRSGVVAPLPKATTSRVSKLSLHSDGETDGGAALHASNSQIEQNGMIDLDASSD